MQMIALHALHVWLWYASYDYRYETNSINTRSRAGRNNAAEMRVEMRSNGALTSPCLQIVREKCETRAPPESVAR